MGYLSVHIYRANGTDQNWIDKAKNALSDMEDQLDFNVYTYDEGNVSVNIDGDYGDMLDNWEGYLDRNNIYRGKYDVHLLIVNTWRLGAGAYRGTVGSVDNSDGSISFVNASVGYDTSCYGIDPVFPPTVIHEVGHAALHEDMSLPANNDEHSAGSVYQDGDDSVSPMQIWYTGDPCSFNPPPSDNCNDRPSPYSEGATNELSLCTQYLINEYITSQ